RTATPGTCSPNRSTTTRSNSRAWAGVTTAPASSTSTRRGRGCGSTRGSSCPRATARARAGSSPTRGTGHAVRATCWCSTRWTWPPAPSRGSTCRPASRTGSTAPGCPPRPEQLLPGGELDGLSRRPHPHRRGDLRILATVAESTGPVAPPADDVTAPAEGTRLVETGAHLGRVPHADDGHGNQRVAEHLARAELPVRVTSPARGGAVRTHRAGVLPPRAHAHDIGEPEHPHGHGRVVGRAVAELPRRPATPVGVVAAPAPRRAVDAHGAGVEPPAVDRGEVGQPDDAGRGG